MASFEALTAANKRNTVLLMVVVAVVLCLLASVIALLVVGWGNARDERRVSRQTATRTQPYAQPRTQPYGQSPGYSGPVEADETQAAARAAAQARARAAAQSAPSAAPPFWQTIIIASGASLLTALILAIFSYYGGAAAILSVSKAHEIKKPDDPQLFNVVEELSIAAGLPMPRIYVIDDTAMNAFATGRDPQHSSVAITSGLREKLTRDELQGVMAHELSHVKNYDIRLTMVAAVMVGFIVLLADLLMRYLWWGGAARRRDDRGNNVMQLVLIVVAVALAILAPIFAKLIQLAISRQREYLADASGAELTRYPQGLASALEKMTGDQEVLEAANRATAHLYIVNPFKAGEQRFKFASLFSTHPDPADRIRRLLGIGRTQ